MGWAEVDERGTFYFAHSYAAETPCATAWSEGIVAEARLASFVGCQFHPEKSGAPGAQYLESVCLSLV
jgi:imidazoleglycerol phosphate synthase glutamine amidotransferase subunit HisH